FQNISPRNRQPSLARRQPSFGYPPSDLIDKAPFGVGCNGYRNAGSQRSNVHLKRDDVSWVAGDLERSGSVSFALAGTNGTICARQPNVGDHFTNPQALGLWLGGCPVHGDGVALTLRPFG